MGDSTRDADADVIVFGREPRRRSQIRPGGLVWLLVVAQVYDLIGSDCSTGDPRPDEVWATGLARADGTAADLGVERGQHPVRLHLPSPP